LKTITGLERIKKDSSLQSRIKGNIGLLCHSASIDHEFQSAVVIFKNIFKDRLKAIYGPQHGFVTDVQDNMVETQYFTHPYFKLPVYSLYSNTRKPTEEMLQNIDTLVVDLQDVGTRVYTYISTLALCMEVCAKLDIEVVVLDRPNPIGGEIVEGNIREDGFFSFVGHHPIPMRHGLTIGEIAMFTKNICGVDCKLQVIQMKNWKRSMFFENTGLPWVLPSPNLPTFDGAKVFPGSVLFEGTNVSEGRGTTRSLEIIGHPAIEPFSFKDHMDHVCNKNQLEGFVLRPVIFRPTFQKHKDTTCGGLQIHVTNNHTFRPWKLGQVLCRELYHVLDDQFEWKKPPYEYETTKMPIDVINGSSKIRLWVESGGEIEELNHLEVKNIQSYLTAKAETQLYSEK